MSNYSKIGIFILLSILAGCSPKIIPFSTADFAEKDFYREMPLILDNAVRIDSVAIYEATFAEKLFEGYYVIDYSDVNVKNTRDQLRYKPYKGYSQKLYLLKLITYPRDSVMVYFSLKYNQFDQCIGFGPSYLGKLNEDRKNLFFYNELYTRTRKDDFYLRKHKLRLSLYMNAPELFERNFINIDKMIVEKSFEIGNNVVIDVKQLFRDTTALKFDYIGTLEVK